MQDQGSPVSFCPSFSSYTNHLSSVAARVRGEEETRIDAPLGDVGSVCSDSDSEFEFVLQRAEADTAEPPEFPIFDRGLLPEEATPPVSPSRCVPLGKLFMSEERGEDHPCLSESESEADEMDGVQPGTYCVWKPNTSPSQLPSPGSCKKSNSTGSSASVPSSSSKPRWRIRDLLRRSRSDGKESYVFLTRASPNYSESNSNSRKASKEKVEVAGKTARVQKGKAKEKVSAHEALYVRNKAQREGDKRRSYLPYRQDLVGFFSTVHGLGRNFPPF